MRTLWQDTCYGTRMLAKSPGMTAVVVLTFALCIGANTAIFSVVNNVLLNPLPQRDPTGLVLVQSLNKERGWREGISGPTWRELTQIENVFSDLVIYVTSKLDWVGEDFLESVDGCLL
jgi:putative ABC transport system permease protein